MLIGNKWLGRRSQPSDDARAAAPPRTWPARSLWLLCLLLLLVAALPLTQSQGQGGRPSRSANPTASNQSGHWPVFGRDVQGSHYNPDEKILTPQNVARLKPRWIFETTPQGGDVSSQPIVVNGVVYFGSWDGQEYAVDVKTGKQLWAYDCGQSTRSAAAYADGTLYFGDIAGFLHALDARTGALKWKKRVDAHPNTVATSSPIYHQGRIYIGVSSHEEGAMLRKRDYVCCTFRGSVAAYDAATGNEVWRFYVIPEPATPQGKDKRDKQLMGPSGGAVWSTVSLDPATRRVYVTTGNQYTGPAVKHTNAILALNMDTGKLLWSHQATPGDIWNFDCRNLPDCSDLDVDFGTAPVFFKGPGGKRLVGAGQKSGWFYALDPDKGTVVWKTEVGPGGKLGGIEFGTATDGERVYAAISNFPRQGSVSALDGATGKILWQTPSPDNRANFGPITVTGRGDNRLVWAGSSGGFIRAYDARDGKILWQFDTGGAVGGGPTVVDGVLYIGSGYTFLNIGKGNNKLYAFALDSGAESGR
jgi:polyvinyl alcohol dehydrogenase (cytochrome)